MTRKQSTLVTASAAVPWPLSAGPCACPALQSVRERRLPPPRGAQSRPARGRAAHGWARPHRGRGRLRQDPRAHAPHRASDPRGGGLARQHPRHHVHQQGVAGDGGARGGPARRAGRRRHVDPDLPRDLLADPAPRARPSGTAQQLHDLRRRRHRAADRAGAARPRPRSQALPAARDRLRRRPGEGPGAVGRRVRPARRQLLRGDRREGVRRVRAAQAVGRRPGLRRPDHGDGATAARHPRGPPPLPGAVPLHPDRRVPGHEPRAVPAGEPAGRAVPEPVRRRRRRPGRVQLAGRHDPEPPGLRARLPRRRRLPDGAELPLHAEHPVDRERR